jgi:hypothetical protein
MDKVRGGNSEADRVRINLLTTLLLFALYRNQRLIYAKMMKGGRTRLSQERIDLMNAVGFPWILSRGRPRKDGEPAQRRKRSAEEGAPFVSSI